MSSDSEQKIADKYRARLTAAGWLEDVAGADFATGVNALVKINSLQNYGIIVSGEYGCGKTSFVKAAISGIRTINCTIPEQVGYLDWENYRESIREMMDVNILIDDLGAERIKNNFGSREDLVGDFICRYHLYGKGRLFITTNLRGEEILERYGGRVLSRLKDLCVPIKFKGADKRVWKL